jgi:hypothetical protein
MVRESGGRKQDRTPEKLLLRQMPLGVCEAQEQASEKEE